MDKNSNRIQTTRLVAFGLRVSKVELYENTYDEHVPNYRPSYLNLDIRFRLDELLYFHVIVLVGW